MNTYGRKKNKNKKTGIRFLIVTSSPFLLHVFSDDAVLDDDNEESQKQAEATADQNIFHL